MKNRKLILWVSIIALCLCTAITVFAIIITNSTKGGIEGTTVTVDANSEFSLASSNSSISFNKEKDNDSIQVKITNNCDAVLHYYYELTYTDTTDLAKAVLVYYDNTFIKALNMFTSGSTKIEDNYAFIAKGETKTENITFELHEAIKGTLLDSKNLNVTLNVYTESVDYINYMFVSNEKEYKSAIDDINSGNLQVDDVPTIVLLNNIVLSNTYTLEKECNLVLNGNSINGTTILNSSDAFMNIIGDDASLVLSFNVTLTQYNETEAVSAISAKIKEKLKYGINTQESIAYLIGTLYPYRSLVTKVGSDYNYLENDTLTALYSTSTKVAQIQVGSEYVDFIIYSENTNIDTYLNHLPSSDDIITTDIYLPTSIASLNASIEWTSSDLTLMDDDGKIVTNYADMDSMTYYAKIKVNNTVYNKAYTFKLSVHNNEVNFSNLLGEISPIVIYKAYNGANQDEAYYYLPIVDEASDYDYRKTYKTPTSEETYTWNANKDISLTKLEYSLVYDPNDNTKLTYDYIGLDGNAVYVDGTTLNTYAQITVTATFITGDTYSQAVNINIAVGTETEILEPAFKNVQEYLDDVNILYSLVSSRIENGMANEKATFTLPGYYKKDSNEFDITYALVDTSSGTISEVANEDGTKSYEIALDPSKFAKTESTVAITVTVSFNDVVVKGRNIYVTVPAILKISDIGNVSLFNSIKYQVYNNLPSNEKTNESGFTITSSSVTNNTADYILIRDIVGDSNYKTNYIKNYDNEKGYLARLEYSETDYVKPIESLKFYVNEKANASSSSDVLAYDFTRLISWAIGSSKDSISSLGLSNTYTIDTSITADGKEYLTTNELNALKTYYEASCSGSWDDAWAQVSEKAPGYALSDTATLNETITDILTNYATKEPQTAYFKYNEIMQVILNKKDHYEYDTSSAATLYFPNFGVIGKRNWVTTYTSGYTQGFTDGKGNTWYYASPSGTFGNTDRYVEDNTDYISEIELEIMKVFWINVCANIGGSWVSSTTNAATYQKKIVDAIDASVTWPEYFVSGGVGKLINVYYDALNIDVNGYSTFIKNDAPIITNMDSLNAIFNYFPNLKELIVSGNSDLSAFLESYTLATFFNKLTSTTVDLNNITMKYCANDYVELDISNIKEFDYLTTIDLSCNSGLTDVAYLVNINSDNYTDVNFQNIGTTYEFLEYTIKSLSSNTCTVRYTNDNKENVSVNTVYSTNKALTYLNEFSEMIAENMFLVDKIYEDSATDSTDVYWKIESGNKIEGIDTAGKYSEIDSVSAMNEFVSPYYYCTSDFTFDNVTFKAKHVYKITSSGTSIAISEIGDANGNVIEADSISDVNDDTLKNYISEEEIKENYEQITAEENHSTFTDFSYGTVTEVSTNNIIYTATTNDYTINFNCFRLRYDDRYLVANSSSLSLSSNVTNYYFCLLNEEEAVKLKNDTFTSSDISNNELTLGASTFPNSSTINDGDAYYIYFPSVKKFLTLSGSSYSLDDTYSSQCRIYYSSSSYYIYNASNTNDVSSTYFLKRNGKRNVTVSTGASSGFSLYSSTAYSYSNDDSTSIVKDNSFKLYDNNNEIIETRKNVYQFGYDEVTMVRTSTCTESYFTDEFYSEITKQFYYNDCIYLITYIYDAYDEATKTYHYTETLTTWRFYYLESNTGDKQVIEKYGVSKYTYNDGSTSKTTNVTSTVTDKSSIVEDGTSENWESATSNYDTWNNNFIANHTYDANYLTVSDNKDIYISYAKEVESSDVISERKELMTKVRSGYYDTTYYLYTGTTGSEDLYKENTTATTSMTYNNGYGYYLAVENNVLVWKQYGSLSQATSSKTLDSILELANTHLNDNQFGTYYHMYYAYSGIDMVTSNGNLYEQYHIYQIELENGKFVYKDVSTYTTYTDAKSMLYDIVLGNIGASDVGKIYYINTTNLTYSIGFYKLTYDADSDSYGLMKFTDIDYDYSLLKFKNRRIYNENNDYLDQRDSNENYGGTGGSFDVVVSAFVFDESGNISERKFKVTVIG